MRRSRRREQTRKGRREGGKEGDKEEWRVGEQEKADKEMGVSSRERGGGVRRRKRRGRR